GGEAVDAVSAAGGPNEPRLLVVDAREARRIAARGASEAVGARRGQREEWRRLDEGAVMAGDAVSLLGDRRPIGFTVDAFQRLDAGNDAMAKIRHIRLPRDHGL